MCPKQLGGPRYSTQMAREPRRSARCLRTVVGVAAAAAPARRANQLLLGVRGQAAELQAAGAAHSASGGGPSK